MPRHGRYTIVRKLANGGMAEIFLASQQGHEGFQKPVVLKRILSSISADPQFRNMLIDEAHISMGLTHSNIVQVLDLGLAGGRYFMVLELIDGWDLGHVLYRAEEAQWPLPAPLGIFVVAEVCRALAYAHARHTADGRPLGIVHRDISPNNVLISDHGEVKLTDFGIAKAMNKREQTGMGVVKGKVAFMSPEQALGKAIDARSDLFSLGTLLYVVITGTKPFDAATDLETLLLVQRAEFSLPSNVGITVPFDVAQIIHRAMQLSPDDRYQSADEMLVDLERALRADFGGVGQTELKQYLAELQRRDGIPSIARAQPFVEAQELSSSPALLEGNAVILGDAQDVGVDEKTGLAELVAGSGGGLQRLGRRGTPADFDDSSDFESVLGAGLDAGEGGGRAGRRGANFGSDQTPARGSRRVVEELSISDEEAEDAPPPRYRRKSSRALPVLLTLCVLAGGGYAAIRYLGWAPAIVARLSGMRAPSSPSSGTAPAPGNLANGERPAAPEAARTERPAAPMRTRTLPPSANPAADPAASPATNSPTAGSGEVAASRDRAAPAAAPSDSLPSPSPSRTAASEPAPSATGPHKDRKARSTGPRQDSVFKDSARRVRSLQGLEQFPPGTIQLSPPSDSPPVSVPPSP